MVSGGKMQKLLVLIASVVLLTVLAVPTGCSDDGGENHCALWCEIATSVELDDLEQMSCELTDDIEEFETECLEVCRLTIADIDGSPNDAWDCIQCAHDAVGGSPSEEQLQGALNGSCEDECLADGMREFWFDFWDDWSYVDYDYECD
jgi:hypothetical protein